MAERIKITTEQRGYSYGATQLRAWECLEALNWSLIGNTSPFYEYTEEVEGDSDIKNRFIRIDIDDFETDFTKAEALAKKKKLYIFKNLIELVYSKIYDSVVYMQSTDVGISLQFSPSTGITTITSNLVGNQTTERMYALILATVTEQYINMQRRYLVWLDDGLKVNVDGVDDTNFFLFPFHLTTQVTPQ